MKLLKTKHRTVRNQYGTGHSTAEFAPAMIVFFLVILFPLINLIMFAAGYGTGYLCAKQCASRAATQNTFSEALNVVQTESDTFVQSGFGQFAKLVKKNGYNNSGIDLSVVSVDINSGTVTDHPKNAPLVNAATPDSSTYEYKVEATYDVGPFMNLGTLPWIGGVPGLGSPATLTFTTTASAEFPEGLDQ